MSLRQLRMLSCLIGSIGLIGVAQPPLCAAQDEDESLDSDDDAAPPAAEPEGEAEAPAEEPAPAGPVPEPAVEEPSSDVVARAVFGGGLGMRSFRRPVSGGGIQRLGNIYFPAADVGISVRVGPRDPFTVDVLIRYQTSLGLVIKEPPIFSLSNRADVRSEHAEVSVAPGWRLGESPSSPRITIPIGGAFRNFWPADHHLQTPRYTLLGGSARLQFEAMLGSVVSLRAGPEAQLYGIIGSDLTAQGVSTPGFAFGGEASLEFRLSTTFLLEVQYRQSNAVSSTKIGPSFVDIERFATVRLAGEM